MEGEAKKVYEFGPFQLDTLSRRLLRDGRQVQLTAKAFDILLLLVQRRRQIIGKDELLYSAWPGQLVDVNNLTVTVSLLRKALGETYRSRIYIETVSGRGYRFIGRVRKILTDEHDATESRQDSLSLLNGTVNSIAILPLFNESRHPQTDYLCDGITEWLIDNLSQLPKLKVIAWSTAFRYKGRKDIRQIGGELGVLAVLTGRVIQQQNNLTVSMELVKVADGSQIWGARYNRKLSDVMAVQEEIARDISAKLRLGPEETKRLGKRYTENTKAYQLYLKGRYLWNQFDREAVERGIKYFKQAIAADPNYALAYSGLADAYLRLAAMYLPPKELLPKAKINALKAVEMDETLAEAHASLGLVKLWHDHDWAGAEKQYLRAIALNHRAVIPHQGYGSYLMFLGRFSDAIAEYEMAQELDPLSLQLYVDLGAALYMMRSYDSALEQFTKALGLEPRYYPARYAVAWIHVQRQDYASAINELRLLCAAGGENQMAQGLLGYVYAVSGETVAARKIHKELESMARRSYVPPYALALSCLGLGENERALRWLKKLYEERSYWLLWLNILPELEGLRSNQGFASLLKRIGLQPAA